MNPIYNTLNGNNIMSQFNQFRRNFSGDPKQVVQQMLDSGKITQDQFNQAAKMANQLRGMIK